MLMPIQEAPSPDWVNADLVRSLIAFGGGAVVAWILTSARDFCRRPVLAPSIDHQLGSLVETTADQSIRQKYARLVVRNTGRSMALNAVAVLDYIRRLDREGTQYVFSSDLITMNWSLIG